LFLCCWNHELLIAQFSEEQEQGQSPSGWNKKRDHISSVKWISKDFRNWLSAQFSKEQGREIFRVELKRSYF
jgi:hypothetical protein